MALVDFRKLAYEGIRGVIVAGISSNSNGISSLMQNRRLRALAAVMAGFLLVVVVITFVSVNTLVKITPSNTSAEVEYFAHTAELNKSERFSSLFGLLIVPRNTEAILAKSSSSETVISLRDQSLAFGYDSLSIQIQEPGKTKLLSIGGKGCPFTVGAEVYSYDCTRPVNFSQFIGNLNGLPKHKLSGDFSTIGAGYQAGQLKEGILVQKIATGRELLYQAVYASPGKASISRKLPDGFYHGTEYIVFVTDKTKANSNAVVVYNLASGTGYYFEDFINSANVKKIQRQYKPQADEQSSCVLHDKQFTCYYGLPGTHSHETEEAGNEANSQPTSDDEIDPERAYGTIERTDLSTGDTSTKAYKGPKGYGISSIFVSASGQLYGRSEFSLAKLELGDDTFSASTIAFNVKMASAGDKLYYTFGNKLYVYDDLASSSRLAYDATGQTIADLHTLGNQVLLSAYVNKDPAQLLQTYQLSTQ